MHDFVTCTENAAAQCRLPRNSAAKHVFKPPNLSALRLIADIYTIAQNDTQILNNSNHVINTSNAISTRIINLPTPNLSTYKLIADIYTIT